MKIVDRIIIKSTEPGFLSKLHAYRKKGYQTEWSGNGAICLAKYEEV